MADDLGLQVGAEIVVVDEGHIIRPLPGDDALGILAEVRADVVREGCGG